MVTFEEGKNCYVMEHIEDWREIATVVVLKGGKDASGNDIVVRLEDEEAMKQYGKLIMTFSEPQWTTNLLCQLRAQQLLANYSKPAIAVRLDAEPAIINVGDSVTFKSSSFNIDDAFIVQSVTYEYAETDAMFLELTNRSVTLTDLLSALERRMERR